MSIKILYLADAGGGKSTSYCQSEALNIKGLNPKSTFVINVAGKQLNMRNWKNYYNKTNGNYAVSNDSNKIVMFLEKIKEKKNIKNIIIDDFQYSFSLKFIDNIKPKANESWGDKYNTVLEDIKKVFIMAGKMREDQIVWILSHVEEYQDEMNIIHKRFKAIGQSTHKHLTPEGLFENVLYGETIQNGERFEKVIRVHGTDLDTCRSAPDLYPLDTVHIPNDLAPIEKEIRDYYNI